MPKPINLKGFKINTEMGAEQYVAERILPNQSNPYADCDKMTQQIMQGLKQRGLRIATAKDLESGLLAPRINGGSGIVASGGQRQTVQRVPQAADLGAEEEAPAFAPSGSNFRRASGDRKRSVGAQKLKVKEFDLSHFDDGDDIEEENSVLSGDDDGMEVEESPAAYIGKMTAGDEDYDDEEIYEKPRFKKPLKHHPSQLDELKSDDDGLSLEDLLSDDDIDFDMESMSLEDDDDDWY